MVLQFMREGVLDEDQWVETWIEIFAVVFDSDREMIGQILTFGLRCILLSNNQKSQTYFLCQKLHLVFLLLALSVASFFTQCYTLCEEQLICT